MGTSSGLLLVAVIGLGQVSQAPAQNFETPASPQPVPVTPLQPSAPLPPIALPPTSPSLPPGSVPLVPATPAFVDNPTRPTTMVDQPKFGLEGCYGSFEITALFPELRGFLSGPVSVMGVPQTVTLGSASLDVTGSPRLEIGYRLPEGLGAVAIVYRSIVSQGGENIPNFDVKGEGFLHTELNVNVVDVDYVSLPYHIVPQWDFAWRAGIRTGFAYFQNQATGEVTQQQATSNFIGAGPHATLELGRAFDPRSGLAVVARLDGAVLIGNVDQSFNESFRFPGGKTIGGATNLNGTQTVPVITFDLGLSYSPPGSPSWARFGIGYQFEYWWDVGSTGASHGDLGINGIYFRGEFNF